jgi:hypothetical protein
VGEIDIAWRRLLREVPHSVLRLAFPRRRFRVVGSATDASVDRSRQLTTDKLFMIRDGRRELVLHVEVELKWRPTLPLRLFDYASAAHVLTRRPIVTVVLLLRKGGRPPRSTPEYRVTGAGRAMVFPYHVVQLASCDARAMKERLPPEGWPLLVPMRGAGTLQAVRALATEIEQHPSLSPRRRETARDLLFLIAAAILGEDVARSAITMESIIQSPGVQAILRHFREEGREQGREEGREEGREQEARSALLRVLARRGLAVTDDILRRVDAERDVAVLEAWLDAAATATSIADVFG